jgi:hypothetical protein
VTFPPHSDEICTSQEPTISLVLHSDISTGDEVFNNYGPKSNAEFILGYGFSLPNNPEDIIFLKISGFNRVWEIGRQAKGASTLWDELLQIIKQNPDVDEQDEYEIQMDAADQLASMVQILLEKSPSEDKVKEMNLRPEVATMWQDYMEGKSPTCLSPHLLIILPGFVGQISILSSLLDFCKVKEAEAVELARSLGIELIVED